MTPETADEAEEPEGASRSRLAVALRWIAWQLRQSPAFTVRHWLTGALATISVGVFVAWCVELRGSMSTDSVRWTLSALVQAIAGVGGLLFVGVTLLWSQASAARSHLRSLRSKYLRLLRGSSDADEDATTLEKLRLRYLEDLATDEDLKASDPLVFGHPKYRTHAKAIYALTALSLVVRDVYELDIPSLEDDELHRQLEPLGYSDVDIDAIAGDVYGLRTDEVRLLDTINVLISPLATYADPFDLVMEVFNLGQDDDLDGNLSRVSMFRRLAGLGARVSLLLLFGSIVAGTFVLLSYREGTPAWGLSLVLALSLASLVAVAAMLEDLLVAR